MVSPSSFLLPFTEKISDFFQNWTMSPGFATRLENLFNIEFIFIMVYPLYSIFSLIKGSKSLYNFGVHFLPSLILSKHSTTFCSTIFSISSWLFILSANCLRPLCF